MPPSCPCSHIYLPTTPPPLPHFPRLVPLVPNPQRALPPALFATAGLAYSQLPPFRRRVGSPLPPRCPPSLWRVAASPARLHPPLPSVVFDFRGFACAAGLASATRPHALHYYPILVKLLPSLYSRHLCPLFRHHFPGLAASPPLRPYFAIAHPVASFPSLTFPPICPLVPLAPPSTSTLRHSAFRLPARTTAKLAMP